MNREVLAVAAAPDGSVYVGGRFTYAGGVALNRIARRVGTAWEPLGSGLNGFVYQVAVAPDGSVVVGGDFTTAGGVPAKNVARWTGTAWEAFGVGIRDRVEALAVALDGSVYAGGSIATVGGGVARYAARWSGTAWKALGTGVNGTVTALAVDVHGDVVLGGSFTSAGGVSSPYVTLYDTPRPVASESDAGDLTGLALSVSPNPVSSGGTVRVAVAEAGPVRVVLYDVLGRQVALLAKAEFSAGPHDVALGAERLMPGVYLVRVTAGRASAVQRLTVAR